MDTMIAIIMGIIQGLTEFFPVSSSAHLTLFPWVFEISDPGLSFDIALHAGTLVAIVIALWSEWIALGRGVLKKEEPAIRMVGFLALTSIPGALIGVAFEEMAETVFRTPLLVATNLIVFGIILWLIDRMTNEKLEHKDMNWVHSALIGISQALAIVPGVSRSGATITAGRALGFKREDAVRYSFMAALPIIFGATLWGLRNVPAGTLLSLPWIAGFTSSLLASVWAMRVLLRYVRNHNFSIFVWWRFGLAGLIVILTIIRG